MVLPLPPQSSSHPLFQQQSGAHEICTQPYKNATKASNHQSVAREADTVKKSSHKQSRTDHLILPPEVSSIPPQLLDFLKHNKQDTYSRGLDKRNVKPRDRQKERMREENGRKDQEVTRVSESNRVRPAVKEGGRLRVTEGERDRHRHRHKNKESKRERERERE